MEQIIFDYNDNYAKLDEYLIKNDIFGIFIVCPNEIRYDYFLNLKERLNINVIYFNDFNPNPSYESVLKGVRLFNESKCNLIVGLGGGSAIDVAKCIKLYCNLDTNTVFMNQDLITNNNKLLAIPTTAGTGSEATRYAVIYYNGEKQSITSNDCIPNAILFDDRFLKTLPLYQKKATLLDALSHSIESYWSVNSTEESKSYSKKAIKIILDNYQKYIEEPNDSVNKLMLEASYYAGKAINITQTTAGHALSYKVTSLFKIAHGHAVAICLSKLWQFMINNLSHCIDLRGEEYLENILLELAILFGEDSVEQGYVKFDKILKYLEIGTPEIDNNFDLNVLVDTVNLTRLKNNPIKLSREDIYTLYNSILKYKES